MYPEQNPNQPPQPTQQPVYGQAPGMSPTQPVVSQPIQQSATDKSAGNSKKPFIIIGAVVVVVLILGTVLAVALGGQAKKPTPGKPTTAQTSGVAPATALTMQQNVDAISQSLSSLDDTKDFPPNALDDTALAH